MQGKEKKLLREKAKGLEPLLRIGKHGLTENVVKEIKKMVRQRKMIKLKLLAKELKGKERKEFGKEIATKTDAELIDQIGNAIVLHRK